MFKEKIRALQLKREFNKYDRLSESWKRKSDSAKEMAEYYAIRADEIVKTTNRLKRASEEPSNYGFAGEP